MASIPPHIPILDATHISTWRPFRPTSPIRTPFTPAHGVHFSLHPQSGRRPHYHMASIPPHILNLATHISSWRPFLSISPIWTPPTPTHGVHSAQHPKSGRHTHQHMASIPPNIHNLDATPTLTWRPFRPTSTIWTPPHHHTGVHSSLHPNSGRRTDAAHSSTWRPFLSTSQFWTPPTSTHGVHFSLHPQSGRRSLQHMASIPPNIPNLDAAQTPHGRRPDATHISTCRPDAPYPFTTTHSKTFTPCLRLHQAARQVGVHFPKIPLSDIKMHNFIPLLKSDENYCTMALTTI